MSLYLGFCIALSNFLSPLCSHFQIGLSQLITEEYRIYRQKFANFSRLYGSLSDLKLNANVPMYILKTRSSLLPSLKCFI